MVLVKMSKKQALENFLLLRKIKIHYWVTFHVAKKTTTKKTPKVFKINKITTEET